MVQSGSGGIDLFDPAILPARNCSTRIKLAALLFPPTGPLVQRHLAARADEKLISVMRHISYVSLSGMLGDEPDF